MSQERILKQILNGTYKPSWKDFKYFTPDFIRQVNTNYDIEYLLFGYLTHTPFEKVDINVLREWKDYHNYMFLQFLTNQTKKRILKLKYQNPAVWNQFCKQWEEEALQLCFCRI